MLRFIFMWWHEARGHKVNGASVGRDARGLYSVDRCSCGRRWFQRLRA